MTRRHLPVAGQLEFVDPAEVDAVVCHSEGIRCRDFARGETDRCRYYLPRSGARLRDCVLDVAERGPRTERQIATMTDESRDGIHSVMLRAFAKTKDAAKSLRALLDTDRYAAKRTPIVADNDTEAA